MSSAWSIYEDAARKVLADIREVLGIATVEGKQSLAGKSGTNWELDAKAWREGSDGFLVIEVRRLTSAGLKQEDLGAIAYRIRDVRGSGGIVVSPLRMQTGARIIAEDADISHVRLCPESTTESYLAEFMGLRFLGATIAEFLTLRILATLRSFGKARMGPKSRGSSRRTLRKVRRHDCMRKRRDRARD